MSELLDVHGPLQVDWLSLWREISDNPRLYPTTVASHSLITRATLTERASSFEFHLVLLFGCMRRTSASFAAEFAARLAFVLDTQTENLDPLLLEKALFEVHLGVQELLDLVDKEVNYPWMVVVARMLETLSDQVAVAQAAVAARIAKMEDKEFDDRKHERGLACWVVSKERGLKTGFERGGLPSIGDVISRYSNFLLAVPNNLEAIKNARDWYFYSSDPEPAPPQLDPIAESDSEGEQEQDPDESAMAMCDHVSETEEEEGESSGEESMRADNGTVHAPLDHV